MVSLPSTCVLTTCICYLQRGVTALHLCAYYGFHEVAELLVAAGANMDITNQNGQTALQLAAVRGHLDTVQVLVQKKCDLDVVTKVHYNVNTVGIYFRRQTIEPLLNADKLK